MGRKKKEQASENKPLGNAELFDDTPEGPWAECLECDTLMEYSRNLERFRCPMCGKEIAEEDYEESCDGSPPFGCRACGGPYPHCMTSCRLFDD
ncbi:MAG: hypothetical protein LBC19_09140 [Tannerella sp.]|jgi:predicted RNA-binding Zn-ribbon protein involved in translation (DUF1610 family)|nr:hypothetical protein [Tannerella sp.]